MEVLTAAILIVAAACSPCLIQAITPERAEITEQYRPFYAEIKAVADLKYQQSSGEINVLVRELNQDLETARRISATNINTIKGLLEGAKKQAIKNLAVTACLRAQDAEAAALSIAPLNVCNNSSANLTALVDIKSQFYLLSNVANNVIPWCQNLSHLDTQDESYKGCLTLKAPDLGSQFTLVDSVYNKLSNATLEYRLSCLAKVTTGIFEKISNISFQVNMCLQKL